MTVTWLVEDDAVLCATLGEVLKRLGEDVIAFSNDRAIVKGVWTDPPDNLVTDIFMPDVDGF